MRGEERAQDAGKGAKRRGPTPQLVKWTVPGPRPAGRPHSLGVLLVGELARVPHYPGEMSLPGGYLHRACPSRGAVRSGQHAHAPVVTAACLAVATGAMRQIDTRHEI